MTQFEDEKITDRVCPICGERLVYFGSIKREGMGRCIRKGHDELYKVEDMPTYEQWKAFMDRQHDYE